MLSTNVLKKCILAINDYLTMIENDLISDGRLGKGHFGAKYSVKGLRLPPTSIHRWIGEWFYYMYNFAPGGFHMRKLCSRLYSIELKFYSQKRQIRFLSRPLGKLGVTYALHL